MTRLQCAAARSVLGWSVETLAGESEVSAQSIYRFERGESNLLRATHRVIELTFKSKGIEFVESDGKRGVFYPEQLDADDAHELEQMRKPS
jgi:ribosome-binding protein aMBF1 (putative translation factor)